MGTKDSQAPDITSSSQSTVPPSSQPAVHDNSDDNNQNNQAPASFQKLSPRDNSNSMRTLARSSSWEIAQTDVEHHYQIPDFVDTPENQRESEHFGIGTSDDIQEDHSDDDSLHLIDTSSFEGNKSELEEEDVESDPESDAVTDEENVTENNLESHDREPVASHTKVRNRKGQGNNKQFVNDGRGNDNNRQEFNTNNQDFFSHFPTPHVNPQVAATLPRSQTGPHNRPSPQSHDQHKTDRVDPLLPFHGGAGTREPEYLGGNGNGRGLLFTGALGLGITAAGASLLCLLLLPTIVVASYTAAFGGFIAIMGFGTVMTVSSFATYMKVNQLCCYGQRRHREPESSDMPLPGTTHDDAQEPVEEDISLLQEFNA